MRRTNPIWPGVLSALMMILFILDSKTTIHGTREGIILCLHTVIPSLFPFFVITTIISTSLTGRRIALLRPLGKLCSVPAGCESLLILGLLGGYPVGAKAIANAYESGSLPKNIAKRLMGFCNNAGPSFIFGLIALQFTNIRTAWIIWGIHISSALLTGMLLPEKNQQIASLKHGKTVSLLEALESSLRVMAQVCGWVVLFRVIVALSEKWFLWYFSPPLQIIFIGHLELVNGICALTQITSESTRFLISCCFLSLGGVCVLMQTISVSKRLGLGFYPFGKVIQTIISFLLSGIIQRIVFPNDFHINWGYIVAAALILSVLTFSLRKKSSSNMQKTVV